MLLWRSYNELVDHRLQLSVFKDSGDLMKAWPVTKFSSLSLRDSSFFLTHYFFISNLDFLNSPSGKNLSIILGLILLGSGVAKTNGSPSLFNY